MGQVDSSAKMLNWFQFAQCPPLTKHILILTAVRVSLYGLYLKCLDNLQSLDPHTRTSKILSVQPPHSSDLNVSDSYVWGHLKPLGYSDPIEKEETLQQRILMHVKPIPTAQGTFEMMRQSIIRRVHACIDSRGGKFEHSL